MEDRKRMTGNKKASEKTFKETSETIKTRTLLKGLLASCLGCAIQHTGYPCNSCFHTLNLDLKKDIHDYWVSVLAFRGDYKKIEPMTQDHWENIKELIIALEKDRKASHRGF